MAIIDTDTNVDLKEGKSLYSCPLGTLNCEELAKVYAYALFEWGDSIQSRIVLDALRGIKVSKMCSMSQEATGLAPS